MSNAAHPPVATPHPLAGLDLPADLARLLAGGEFYSGLDAVDLREMAKFDEAPNIHGLPLHRLEFPVGEIELQEFPGSLEEMGTDYPDAAPRRLRRLIDREPLLIVRGMMAGALSRPMRVAAFIPQSQARLAAALEATLWPWPADAPAARADLFLVQIPELETDREGRPRGGQLAIHLPALRLTLSLGTDDPRPALLIAIEAANRLWMARAEELVTNQEATQGEIPPPAAKPEDIRLLAGGSFVIDPAPEGDAPSAATLVFAGESAPVQWEAMLAEKIPELASEPPVAIALACAEPWVAEGGGWVCPLWRNPLLPAAALAAAPAWEVAALEVGALPFGAGVDERGAIDLAGAPEDAFVVVPREAIPAPYARGVGRIKVARLLTHRHSKNEAMELWARGFPKAESLNG